MQVRVLAGEEVDDVTLRDLYAFPEGVTMRTNFVTSIDGAATGADGVSGSINNPADKLVYDLNRALCQVVIVGARTADTEGYRPAPAGAPPVVAVTNHGQLPRAWPRAARSGGAILVVPESLAAGPRRHAVDVLGEDNVWPIGHERVDFRALIARLAARGWGRILCEGGPRLHAALLAEGLVDQLALSWVPGLVGGGGPRIVAGQDIWVGLRRRHLLDIDGTLLGLWDIER